MHVAKVADAEVAVLVLAVEDDEPDPDPNPGNGDQPDRTEGADESADSDASGVDGASVDSPTTDSPEVPADAQAEAQGEADAPEARDSGTDAQNDSAADADADANAQEKPAEGPADPASDNSANTPAGGPEAAPPGTVASATEPYRTRLLSVAGTGHGAAGKRSRALTSSGRRIGSGAFTGSDLHLPATVRAAARWQSARGRGADDSNANRGGGRGGVRGASRGADRLLLAPEDLRSAVREGRESNLVLFCVDASGSMAARKRMEQVKTAILSLLLDAYRRRDTVGLVTFRGSGAEVALPPTSSVDIAATRLEQLPAGGRTPLAEGLLTTAEVLRVAAVRDPRRRALVVVVTDGRATHSPDALARARTAAAGFSTLGATTVVVDCETGRFRMGLAADLAARLGAEHVPLGEVTAEGLAATVRARTHTRGATGGLDDAGRTSPGAAAPHPADMPFTPRNLTPRNEVA